MFYGDMREFDRKSKKKLIKDYGVTRGLAIWLACKAVNKLETGNWEDVAEIIYETLVDYIDE